MRDFQSYLIMVGIRSVDYTYTDDELFDNIKLFKGCYDNNISAYKALEIFLKPYMDGEEITFMQ